MYRSERLILSNTEDLHARIEELTERVKELEEALETLQVINTTFFISSPHQFGIGSTFKGGSPLASWIKGIAYSCTWSLTDT
jgi:hypothetical protein